MRVEAAAKFSATHCRTSSRSLSLRRSSLTGAIITAAHQVRLQRPAAVSRGDLQGNRIGLRRRDSDLLDDSYSGSERAVRSRKRHASLGKSDAGTSHFFFEQAVGQDANRSDTLEVSRYDGNTGAETTILPQYRSSTISDQCREMTSPSGTRRSSATPAISGEPRSAKAEPPNGSRVMTYDADTVEWPVTLRSLDRGVSQAADVTDFVANSFAKVQGVAMNFDGSLSGVSADSTYLLNPALRLQGILATTQSNAGLDFHPQNSGPNSFPLSTVSCSPRRRAADRDLRQLLLQESGDVPIRDPIIGPIKAALRPSTGQIVLVGATARGVVIVYSAEYVYDKLPVARTVRLRRTAGTSISNASPAQ